MNNGYIAIMDSGVGGISVLKELIKQMPRERFLYFGDNDNAPYGIKSKRKLLSLAMHGVDVIRGYGVKVLVLGCNTLSVMLFNEIKEYSGIPTFGVYPPVEKAVMQNSSTLMLATELTASQYKNYKNFNALGLTTLAADVENNIYNINRLSLIDSLNNHHGYFVNEKGYYKTVILGCTHYNFIKKQIVDHFRPQITLSGDYFTALKVKEYLRSIKSLVNNKRFEVLFVGENASKNKKIFIKSGQLH